MTQRTRRLFTAGLAVLLTAPTLVLAADDAHGHGVEAAHAEPSLVPSVPQSLTTALTTLVVFVILLAVLRAKAWGPIAAGLEARERKIREDIQTAERARAEGEAALASYKSQIANADAQVREKLAVAQKDAEAIATRLKMDAQAEIEEMKVRASREIEEQKNAALAEVRQHAAQLSTSVASKILKRQINDGDQSDLIRSALEELQATGRR